jgi:hypothetical protein
MLSEKKNPKSSMTMKKALAENGLYGSNHNSHHVAYTPCQWPEANVLF